MSLHFLARILIVLAAWLLCSCQLRLHRTLHHDELCNCAPKHLEIRQRDHLLAFKFSIPGRNVAALGSCATVARGEAQAGRLILSHQRPDDFLACWKEGSPVHIVGPEVWQKLIRTTTSELAPKERGTASLLILENLEGLAYRDAAGVARLVPLQNRPPNIKIRRTYRPKEIAKHIFDSGRNIPELKSGSVMILTGQSPPLVFFDGITRRLTFLHAPVAEPYDFSLVSRQEPALPFSVRTATAFVWSTGLTATLNNPVSSIAKGYNVVMSICTKLVQWRPRGFISPVVPAVNHNPPMNLAEWERKLATIAHSKPHLASLEFLIDGEAFFTRYIQALQNAKQSIDVRLYIFDNDDYAVKLANLLKEKSQQSVQVRVMMDQLGSRFASQSDPLSPMPGNFVAPPSMENYLRRDSHVSVRPLANPWLASSHSKTFLVDGNVAWLGGMNFGREYRFDWHDLMVEVKGPLVGHMQKDFNRAWAHAGPGGDFALLKERLFPQRSFSSNAPVPPDAVLVRPLYTTTFRHEIEKSQRFAMRHAQQRIWIQNAYLTDHRMIRELIAARRRGVDVRIILPEKNDSGIIAASQLVTISDLMQNGIRVYSYPGMTHVKAALYDGWACLGSANFDRFSLHANHEFNIGFTDPKAVNILAKNLFERDFKTSHELQQLPEIPWTSYLADWLANEL